MTKKNINLAINLDDILQRIYTESARRALAFPDTILLTPDNDRLLAQYIEDGLNDANSRMSGYVTLCSYNPNATERNIVLQLTLRHAASIEIDKVMHDALLALLVNYALLRFYGERDTYYGTAWRKYRAQLLLVLARDQAAIAQ